MNNYNILLTFFISLTYNFTNKMKAKLKNKYVNALELLFIGEAIILPSLVIELKFLAPWISLFAFLALVGQITKLVGIFRLRKLNKYFLLAFIAVLLSFLSGIITIVLNILFNEPDYENVKNLIFSIQLILPKAISIIYTYGVLRGCSKAATGNPVSKFGRRMIVSNTICKMSSIALNILAPFVQKYSVFAANLMLTISFVITLGIEIYFVVYLGLTYSKAKSKIYNN